MYCMYLFIEFWSDFEFVDDLGLASETARQKDVWLFVCVCGVVCMWEN